MGYHLKIKNDMGFTIAIFLHFIVSFVEMLTIQYLKTDSENTTQKKNKKGKQSTATSKY